MSFKLKRIFDERVQEESLKPLLPLIQGLMRFRPSDRISVSQALDLVKKGRDMGMTLRSGFAYIPKTS